jgi:putative colanic acid biosynthesis acetyltransferase WcaF
MGKIYQLMELCFNRLLTHIPSTTLKRLALRHLGASIGNNVYLYSGIEILNPKGLSIGDNCHVGRFCQLDARGGIAIGNNVCIAGHVIIITADHDVQTSGFEGRLAPVDIGDYSWLCTRSTVLKGTNLQKGCVVAAGSVVIRDVSANSIVSGVPAKPIAIRNADHQYKLDIGPRWF